MPQTGALTTFTSPDVGSTIATLPFAGVPPAFLGSKLVSETGAADWLKKQAELDNPTRYISACQLGITFTTLALGAIGEETFAVHLSKSLEGSLTGLHMQAYLLNICKLAIYI